MRRRKNFWSQFSVDQVQGVITDHRYKLTVLFGGLVLLFALGMISFISTPPSNFNTEEFFTVDKGMTVSQIASSLKDKHYIRSKTLFKVVVAGVYGADRNAVAGEYNFDKPITTFEIAQRIVAGDFDLTPIKVTVPEGLNKFELSALLDKKLPNFDQNEFIALAEEGYMFPDTYFFVPNIKPKKVVEMMRENFDKKIASLEEGIVKSGRSKEDVIKMASIIETEARKFETRQIISDILWRRLDTDMPLQVDVTFKYVNGKTTFDLTLDDLNIDSPYNSYRYKGLPPTPIANPGLDSILAAISPKDTKYLFFLSDHYGNMHYAVTFDEHKKNKAMYLQ
ncbi:MAG TPA: endolytic transglycosylase MltG [Candidatus Nanoarchaeia archaeon]|nr:endolytic transglycosylase MltG [Candidatus Nanoarchaeia archaeon]